MRKLLPVLLLVLAGCQTSPPAAPAPVVPPTPPAPQAEAIPMPPVRPSDSFLKGYWDGYNGTWLAPGRWLVVDDYRQGWSLGNHDKRHGIHRYPPELRP